jgi:hypothetical protein
MLSRDMGRGHRLVERGHVGRFAEHELRYVHPYAKSIGQTCPENRCSVVFQAASYAQEPLKQFYGRRSVWSLVK